MVLVAAARPEISGVPSPVPPTLAPQGSPCGRAMRLGIRDGGLGPCMWCKDGLDRGSQSGDLEVLSHVDFLQLNRPLPVVTDIRQYGNG